MDNTERRINKDLILRERLAIERTDMAIDRTLLSFIRTSLYFAIAGMTVNSLLKAGQGWRIEILFWILAIIILLAGILRFKKQKDQLKKSERHIGNYQLELENED